jgi:hypothetical protein
MAAPVSISLKEFTSSAQAAVKAAIAKHPKFKFQVPNAISISYLIRGFPVPDDLLAQVTLAETQAFAADVATQLAQAHPQVLAAVHQAAQGGGTILSVGRHVLIGIPAPSDIVQVHA